MIPVHSGGVGPIPLWEELWTCSVPGIEQDRLAGLGFNPAAPDAVLIRLMEHTSNALDFLWRTNLPPSVVEAALEHPRWQVRGHLLETHQFRAFSSQQWARLLEGPTAEQRRKPLIVRLCAESGTRLPSDLVDRLAHDPAPAVRAVAATLPGATTAHLTALAADPEPKVRAAATPCAWTILDAAARQALLGDPEPQVRTAALLHLHQDEPIPAAVLDQLPGCEHFIARNCVLTPEVFRRLADGDPGQRLRVDLADNPHLAPEQVAELTADPDPWVRLRVSVRPELTEQQRAAIPLEISEQTTSSTLPWVAALHHDPAAMRRLAHSTHPIIRRSVARAKHLPPDVVAHLTHDPDRTVHPFLAESCHDATPEVLLSVAAWWSGSLSQPDRPRSNPNFPRTNLLRFARDPNPLLRRLALDDPKSDATLTEKFSHDPHEIVRARAAADPRLSAKTLDRLLDEPDMHDLAARNPSLPVTRLVELLCSPRSARAAVANPRIPSSVMHRILDDATCATATLP